MAIPAALPSCPSSCPGLCKLPPSPRRFCRHRLVQELGSERVEEHLAALVRLGVLRSYKVIGEVVFLDGERPQAPRYEPAWRPTPYTSPLARVEAAAEVLLEVDPDDRAARRRAQERFRRAAWAWFLETAGGARRRGALARWRAQELTRRRPRWDRRAEARP